MIWRNPLAWLGLLAVAVPILVHLIGRRKPRPLPFPTLRFVVIARTTPARRHRLTDLPLLAVRVALIAAAVAALAQPWWRRPAAAGGGSAIARAVVVDTSVSMTRVSSSGRTGLDEARAGATTAISGAAVSRVVEAPALQTGIPAALGWLATQTGLHELVVISDFQRGAIDAVDIAGIPAHVGLTFTPIAVQPATIASAMAHDASGRAALGHVTLSADATTVDWRAASDADNASSITVLSAPADRVRLDAAIAAARADAPARTAADRRVTMAFPGAPDEIAIWRSARAINAPWMFDVVAAVRDDATLARVARTEPAPAGPPTQAGGVAVVFEDAAGQPRLVAATTGTGGVSLLTFLVLTPPGDLFSAALIRAVSRAIGAGAPASEQEPQAIAPSQLQQWSRPATGAPAGTGVSTDSDGRWLWLLALLLLGVEAWMRRRPAIVPAATAEVPRARVA